MPRPFDVIIVGAGSAGLAALREVRKRTANFLLVNHGPYGTTCARVGCMPSKALIEAANAYHFRRSLATFGVRGGEALRVDIPAVLRRVRALRDHFVASTLKATDGLGEQSVTGHARLTGPDRVEVDGRAFSARRIILATGSRPVVPEEWRSFGDRVLTTDDLFEQADLPGRIGVIGLGAIGVEIAQALSRLGIEVSAFGANARLGGLTDELVSAELHRLLEGEYVIHTGSPASLRETAGELALRNAETTVIVDRVIAAIGRRPNIDRIGIESLGIKLDEAGLPPVDPTTMQVADLPVYLAGDANAHAPLLHEAADEGHIAGLNALADTPACFRRRTPLSIVFSDPGIAMVGKRFSLLDRAEIVTGQAGFERQGRALMAQRNRGLLRIYADRQQGRLLGAEMCVPAAEHLAHVLALAIGQEMTAHDLLRMPFYHPVLEEGLRTALRSISRHLSSGSTSDLAGCDAYGSEALD